MSAVPVRAGCLYIVEHLAHEAEAAAREPVEPELEVVEPEGDICLARIRGRGEGEG